MKSDTGEFYSTCTSFLTHFTYFEKMKVGLWDLHAACVSVHPPPRGWVIACGNLYETGYVYHAT
jgi:hypothetical protein